MMSAAYPYSPAPGQTDTSAAAAEGIAPSVGRLQQIALAAVRGAGSWGLTTQELAEQTNVDFSSIQPRTSELRRLGLIRDSGRRRPNRSGKRTIVWEAAKDATKQEGGA